MKIAVVTGGSRGLGKGIVEGLEARGWKVLEISRSGEGEDHFEMDMSAPLSFVMQTKALFEAIEHAEEIALISNAGMLTPIAKSGAMETGDMVTSFNVNIISALTMIQAFVKQFRDRPIKKSIVSISSGAATKGYPGWSLYCAGKAACENYMRTLSMEEALEEHPFQVISYNPGVMDTEMQGEIRDADPEQFPMQPRFINLKKDGDLRDPKAVAENLIEVIESGYCKDEFIYSIND